MGYIYKITNDINDKVYVGKTLSTIEERWKVHCRDARKGRLNEIRPLYRAMNKYGAEHFKIELIGKYNDNELEEQEIYWIDYYHGYTDGYNATKGGDGKMLYDHNAIKKELFKCPYPTIVAKKFNCCVDVVRDIAKANNIKAKNYFTDNLKIKIDCYDKITKEYIASFDSILDAAIWCCENGKCGSCISECRANISESSKPDSNRKTAYGYIWIRQIN